MKKRRLRELNLPINSRQEGLRMNIVATPRLPYENGNNHLPTLELTTIDAKGNSL